MISCCKLKNFLGVSASGQQVFIRANGTKQQSSRCH